MTGETNKTLANQWLDVDVKSLRSSEVWINTVLVQNYLSHTLLNQLVIQRPTMQQPIRWLTSLFDLTSPSQFAEQYIL